MKKSMLIVCSIVLMGLAVSGCTPSEKQASSATRSSTAESRSSGALESQSGITSGNQSGVTSEHRDITLEEDRISKDLVFRKTSAADGTIVLTSDKVEKIEMKPSQESTFPGEYSITFYLTEEGREQFASVSREFAEAEGELSIWVKDDRIASATVTDPISDGIFVLNGSFDYEEAKQRIDRLSAAS